MTSKNIYSIFFLILFSSLFLYLQDSHALTKEKQKDYLSIKKTVNSFMKLRSKGIHRTKEIRREMSVLVNYKVSDGDGDAVSYDDREVYDRYKIKNIEIINNEATAKLAFHQIGMVRNFREFKQSDRELVKSLYLVKKNGKWLITNGLNPEYWKAVIMKVEEQNENDVYKMNHRAFSMGRAQYHKRLDSGYDWLVYNESKMIAMAERGIKIKVYKANIHEVIAEMYMNKDYKLANEDGRLIDYLKEHATLAEIRLLKNAIFARKGYKFNDPILTTYFKENFPGYRPRTKQVSMSKTDIENKEQIFLIERYAKQRDAAN